MALEHHWGSHTSASPLVIMMMVSLTLMLTLLAIPTLAVAPSYLTATNKDVLQLPAALWSTFIDGDAVFSSASVNTPWYGIRYMLSTDDAASMTSLRAVLPFESSAIGSNVSVMVQSLVTTADGTKWDPSMFVSVADIRVFEEASQPVGCSAILTVDDATLLPAVVSVDTIEPTNISGFAGGYPTCTWANAMVIPLGFMNAFGAVALDIGLPSEFDAVTADPMYSLLVWIANDPMYIVRGPRPQSSYAVVAGWNSTFNVSVVGATIAASNPSLTVNPHVTTSEYVPFGQFSNGIPFSYVEVVDSSSSYTADSTLPLQTTGSFDSAVTCFVPIVDDGITYLVEKIPARAQSVNMSFFTSGGDSSHVYPYSVDPLVVGNSVLALKSLCDADPLCLGFDTIVDYSTSPAKEVPGQMYAAKGRTYTLLPMITRPRLMHWKRSSMGSSRCTTSVAAAGVVDVLLANANVEAIVVIDDVVVGSCNPMTALNDCGQWQSCGEFNVQSGSIIEVFMSNLVPAPTCAMTELRVLLVGRAANDPNPIDPNSTVVPVTPAVLSASDRSALQSTMTAAMNKFNTAQFTERLSIPRTATSASIRLTHIHNVSVLVQQSFFNTSAAAPYVVRLHVESSAATGGSPLSFDSDCGGASQMGGYSGFEGLRNRCDLYIPCMYNLLDFTGASPMQDFSGAITITVNWTAIDTTTVALWDCDTTTTVPSLDFLILGTTSHIYSSSSNGVVGTSWSGSSLLVEPLILAPLAQAPTVAFNATLFDRNITYKLGSRGSLVQRDAYALQFMHNVSLEAPSNGLGEQLCQIGGFRSDFVTCKYPVPLGALQVEVWVEDSNLVGSDLEWALRDGVTNNVYAQGTCGATAGLDGGASSPTYGSCGVFRRCFISNIAGIQTLSSSAPSFVELTVPSSVASATPCASTSPAFQALATFNTSVPVTETCLPNAFVCPSTGECLPISSVCNGAIDCSDGADESSCYGWIPVKSNATVSTSAPYAVVFNSSNTSFGPIASAKVCRNYAIRSKYSLFAYNDISGQCLVYAFATSSSSQVNLDSQLIAGGDFTVSVKLSSRLQYATCSRSVTCAGNGEAYQPFPQRCACICDSLYTGDDCSEFQSMSSQFTEVFLVFSVSSDTTDSIPSFPVSKVASALQSWIPGSAVSCQPPLRLNSQSISVSCSDRRAAFTQAIISNVSAIASFNRYFIPTAPAVLAAGATSIAPTAIPRFESSTGACTMVSSATVMNCTLPSSGVNMDSVVVSMTPQSKTEDLTTAYLVVNVTYLDTSSSSRRSGAVRRTVQISCPGDSVAFAKSSTGRTVMTCYLNIQSVGINGAVVGYTTVVTNGGVPVTLSTSGSDSTRIAWRRSLLLPHLYTPPNPATIENQYSILVALGVAAIGLGICLMCAAITSLIVHRRHVKRVLRRTAQDSTVSALQKVVVTLFLRMTKVDHVEYYSSDSDDGEAIYDTEGNMVRPALAPSETPKRNACSAALRKSHSAFCCSAFWLCFWIIGTFFILWYATSSGVTSDTWLVVERFSDASCQNSTMAPTPTAVFYVKDTTAVDCTRRHITGSTSVRFYFAGYCLKNTSGTNVIAKYKTGRSLGECQSTAWTEVTSDTCLPSQTIWGQTTDATFTRIVCGSTPTTINRFGYMVLLSDPTVPTVTAKVVAASSTVGGGGSGSISGLRRTAGSFTQPAAKPWRFDSIGVGGSQLMSQDTPGQFLFQVPSEVFSTPHITATTAAYAPTTEALSNAALDALMQDATFASASASSTTVTAAQRNALQANPSISSDFLIPTAYPELSVGQVYGKFNITGELQGSKAGPTATRYYGMQRTNADVGAFLNLKNMEEGQGFSISFQLKASRASYGFAFALTDGFEDITLGSSPILDMLLRLIGNNADASYWFTDDYHVYHALFVDGPSMTLSFVYATPSNFLGAATTSKTSNVTTGKTMTFMSWDLTTLSLTRLLNGLWHQVVIVIRKENGQFKVQLIVDGETSRSVVGWNQCLSKDGLPSVASFPQGSYVGVFNDTQQVGTQAILWTGYFNGGVGQLTYYPYVDDIYSLWRASSLAVKQHNSINEDGYTYLGYVMLGIAGAGGLYLIFGSGRAMYIDANRADRSRVRAMYLRFMGLVGGARPDPTGATFRMIKYNTAKRWLGLSDRQLGQFLDEQAQATSQRSEELIRVLYLCGVALRDKSKKDIRTPMPTAEAWKALIEDDENRYIESTSRRWICPKPGHVEEDVFSYETINLEAIFHRPATASPSPIPDDVEMAQREQLERERAERARNFRDAGDQAQAVQLLLQNAIKAKPTERKNEAGEINTGNLTFSNGAGKSADTKALNIQPQVTSAFAADIKQLFFPVLSVVQSVYLWMTSSQLVGEYLTYFSNFFSFVSIDWVTSFELPALVTPLVQLVAGLMAFLILLYLTALDEIRFSWYVARYVLRRDNVELVEVDLAGTLSRATNYCNKIIQRFPDPFGKWEEAPHEYEVEVFPVKESMKIDRFVGLSDVKDDSAPEADADEPAGITVVDANGGEYLLKKSEGEKSSEADLVPKLVVERTKLPKLASNTSAGDTTSLEFVGVFCREHPDRRLSPQVQTDVWPFLFAPKCCVVMNGVRCNGGEGIIYSCQHFTHQHGGAGCLCDFAVCERHYRGGVFDGIKADALAVVRNAEQRGSGWVFATIVMLISNAAYMPFVKTAVMILACHPMFQCQFKACHDFSNQEYLIAFYFALSVVVLFGLGLPLLQTLQLRRRRALLLHIFFADEYKGKYEEKDEKNDEETILEQLQINTATNNLDMSMEASLRTASRQRPRSRQSDHAETPKNEDPVAAAPDIPVAATPNRLVPLTDEATPSPSEEPPVEPVAAQSPIAKADEDQQPGVVPSSTDATPRPAGRGRPHQMNTPSVRFAGADEFGPDNNANQLPITEVDDLADSIPALRDDDADDILAKTAKERDMHNKELTLAEWGRFLTSDPTVLGTLYKSLEFQWIFLSPIILIWKVILICPAVFLDSDTFQQAVGICATEAGFAVFMFLTAPFLSPMVDLMYRVGCVHQLLFLGFRSLDTVSRYRGDIGYGTPLVLLTLIYLGFSVACTLWTVIGPQIRKAWDTSRTKSALEELGYQYSLATSLYVVPTSNAVRYTDRFAFMQPIAPPPPPEQQQQ